MDNLFFIIKSIILGIIEGITEFLPVSSTGHMVIAENLMHFSTSNPNYVTMYTYVIQLGAILAVIILYFKKLWGTVMTLFPKKEKRTFEQSGLYFWLMIVVACIPGGIIGILLDDFKDKYLFTPYVVAITLFFGGIFMLLAEKYCRPTNKINSSQTGMIFITPKQAIIIGLFQCLSIIPGMSRSASTIIGGWIVGLSTVASAEFSFFLAIPVMIGMTFLKLLKIGGLGALTGIEVIALIVGFVVSLIVALIVIRKFIDYLKKKSMRIFSFYRMVFAIVVLIAGLAS